MKQLLLSVSVLLASCTFLSESFAQNSCEPCPVPQLHIKGGSGVECPTNDPDIDDSSCSINKKPGQVTFFPKDKGYHPDCCLTKIGGRH